MLCFGGKQINNKDKRKSLLIDKELKRESKLRKHHVRILFLGDTESGKTTILKQMKIIHLNGFTAEERIVKRVEIYGNIHTAIYTLIMNLKKFGIHMSPSAFKSSTQICKSGINPPDEVTPDYVRHLELVWRDEGIQQLHEKRHKFKLIDNAKYFLDRLDVIYANDYVPTDADILRSRTIACGVDEIKLTVKDRTYKYNLTFVDIGGCARTKWVQLFEGVSIVFFVVASSSFDELVPTTEVNRLAESIDLFRTIWHNKFLRNSHVIVFLNKIDLLEEKLARGKKILKYFDDYAYFDLKYGYGESMFDVTKQFIRYKFEKIASEPIQVESMFDRKSIMRRGCKIHFLVAINTDECKETYEKCKQTIIMRALHIYELH